MRPMSLNSASYPFSAIYEENLEARARIELANKGFADLCLTTWLPRPDCRRAGNAGGTVSLHGKPSRAGEGLEFSGAGDGI